MNSPIRSYEETKRRLDKERKEKIETYTMWVGISFVVLTLLLSSVKYGYDWVVDEMEQNAIHKQVINALADNNHATIHSGIKDIDFLKELSHQDASTINVLSEPDYIEALIEQLSNGVSGLYASEILRKIKAPIKIEDLIKLINTKNIGANKHLIELIKHNKNSNAVLLLALNENIDTLPDPRHEINELCRAAKEGKITKIYISSDDMYMISAPWQWHIQNKELTPPVGLKLSPDMTIESVACISEESTKVFGYGINKPVYGNISTGIDALKYTWHVYALDVQESAITAETKLVGPSPPKFMHINKFDRPKSIGTRPHAELSSWLSKLTIRDENIGDKE